MAENVCILAKSVFRGILEYFWPEVFCQIQVILSKAEKIKVWSASIYITKENVGILCCGTLVIQLESVQLQPYTALCWPFNQLRIRDIENSSTQKECAHIQTTNRKVETRHCVKQVRDDHNDGKLRKAENKYSHVTQGFSCKHPSHGVCYRQLMKTWIKQWCGHTIKLLCSHVITCHSNLPFISSIIRLFYYIN